MGAQVIQMLQQIVSELQYKREQNEQILTELRRQGEQNE